MASSRTEGQRTPRLFTARYSNRTLAGHPSAKVRTTLGYPRFRLGYRLAANLAELAPARSMFGKSEAEFTEIYAALLEERGGVDYFTRRFAQIADEAGVDQLVLLCFEDLRKPGLFCHRRVFATWWQQRTGQPVDELSEEPEPSPKTNKSHTALERHGYR
jgi:hypothetical protein